MSAVERIVADRAERLRDRVAARLADALPGVRVEREGERLVVTGRGLIARFLAKDALRDWREDER